MAYSIGELVDGVLLFTIEREEKRNAINFDVMEGLEKLIKAAQDDDIKAVAVTGIGQEAFCSGGDLSVFHSLKTKNEAFNMLSRMARVLYALLTLPKPTLAILNGTAVGGGCELAAACDFRIGKKGTKAGFIQGQQGIITGWGGGSILSEKMPAPSAMRMLMGGGLQPVEELSEMGFIDWIYEGDPLHAGRAFLAQLTRHEGAVLQGFKTIWIHKWEESQLRGRIEKEVGICATLWESEAHHRQVAKFLNKNR
ncbi:enoyl-CoA hydratase/isomerase family protein [Neobacillus notoginsengisoli]|uniref:Enoyl-CoA hydratase/isomerase family protein n=1 Tax=Neobacillus notoginsengisoli TaxID=1578198 RepID=A0A417YR37_9BACI|nr:enoyl-CoA hydratase/isomerase family protein [Neobacillus notoginsengisoli]RHW36515.1 enoyl-CoA hydratase/isomerase family protein [Neobacillus notoginsengisoli]